MNRRRRLLFAVLLATPVVALGVACTFPDVSFNDGSSEAGTEATTSSSSSSSGNVNAPDAADAGDTGKSFFDANEDVTSRVEPTKDAAGCSQRCDCDDDGYLDKYKDACADGPTEFDDANAKLPGDCDDTDLLAHPGANASESQPSPNAKLPGDFNCDGKVSFGILDDFACSGTAIGGLCTDNGDNGKFDGPQACGVPGDIYKCVGSGIGCKPAIFDQKPQKCK